MNNETENIGNNKRIAKNTLFLYFRMLLTMGVSLYTSRIVLDTLGVNDYGIYNVVGGVVVILGFLNSSMSGATSRFLTFELGREDSQKLKETFSAALTIHFIIAGIILILGETAGLWWLENKLVVDPDRMVAARWVYQLSLLSAMVSITQVPYNATIIAHERMNVYAYVEILNSLMKLGIVFLLVAGNFDKLILYAILTLCVSIIIAMIYRLYCLKSFSESHYKFSWNKEIIHPMLSFSGWDLYGNMCVTAKTEGVNVLLNHFFGAAINAAYGIATQVNGVVLQFSNNFLTAVRPQIVKYYAANEIIKMQDLMINSAKFSFLLIYLISFPLTIENHFILHLWLKEVPEYAVVFCQLNMVSILVTFLFGAVVVIYAVHATGKIKNISILGGSIYILVLPISYIFLKLGYSPVIPLIINALLMLIYCLAILFVLKSLFYQVSILQILIKVTFVCLLLALLSSLLPSYFHFHFDENWKRFVAVGISFIISISFSGYFIILSKDMRKKLLKLVLNKLKFKYA